MLKLRHIILFFFMCLVTSNGIFSQDDSGKEEMFNKYFQAAKFYQSFDPDSARLYTDSCLSLADEMESEFYLGKALQLKTRDEFFSSEVDSAIYYGNQSLEILKNYPDSVEYFLAEYNLGNCYLSQEDYIQALVQFKKATRTVDENLETYLEVDPDMVNLNRSYCHASIGLVLMKLDDFHGAIKSFKTSMKISHKVESLDSEIFRSVMLNRLGDAYVQLEEYQIAEGYAIASMEQKKKLGQESSIGFSYQVMAESAFGRKKFDLCLRYLEQSNKKFEKRDNWNEMDRNAFLEAKCFLALRQFDKALNKLKGIEETYLTSFTKRDQADYYEVLSAVYNRLEDYKTANDYLRISLRLRKEIDIKHDQKVVGEFVDFIEEEELQLNTRIEGLKNKQEKEKLEFQIEAERDKKVWIYTLFLVSIVCLVLIILVISNAYRRNRRVMKVLTNKMEENKILFKEVHHRVKNNFQIISSLLNLQQGVEEDEKSREVLTDAQGRIQSMSLVHEMLYRKNEVKSIDFKSYSEELASSIITSFNIEKDIQWTVKGENKSFDLEVAIPLGLILNEAITNSLKYAFTDRESGKIDIEMKSPSEGNYILEVKDNGIGISEENSSGRKETLGLELINILADQLEGKVEYFNNGGTKMVVTFKA